MSDKLEGLLREEERLLLAISEANDSGERWYALELGESLEALWRRIDCCAQKGSSK